MEVMIKKKVITMMKNLIIQILFKKKKMIKKIKPKQVHQLIKMIVSKLIIKKTNLLIVTMIDIFILKKNINFKFIFLIFQFYFFFTN